MANTQLIFVGTVEVSTPVPINISALSISSIQITASGANTITVKTKIKDMTTTTEPVAVSGGEIILDLVEVSEITFTASGGDVPIAVYGY